MEYVFQYLFFLAQAITIVVAILVVLSAIVSLSMKRQQADSGHLEIIKLNDRLKDLRDGMRQAVYAEGHFKKLLKRDAKAEKKEEKKAEKQASRSVDPSGSDPQRRRRVFVIDFRGDLQASRVKLLRTEITAVLTLAEAADTVLVRLESPGGAVHGYGLAASQLDRVKQHGIPLIAAVDKVAASGGYLMAAVADRILAAPFAVIGSIGVIAQVPNVHRLLKKHDVDVDVLTAGKYKRTLTVLGENTEEGRQKFIEELEDLHSLFQEFVGSRRPALDIDRVADRRSLVRPACARSEARRRDLHERRIPGPRLRGRGCIRSPLGRAQEGHRATHCPGRNIAYPPGRARQRNLAPLSLKVRLNAGIRNAPSD